MAYVITGITTRANDRDIFVFRKSNGVPVVYSKTHGMYIGNSATPTSFTLSTGTRTVPPAGGKLLYDSTNDEILFTKHFTDGMTERLRLYKQTCTATITETTENVMVYNDYIVSFDGDSDIKVDTNGAIHIATSDRDSNMGSNYTTAMYVNNVGGSIANVNTVANNLTDVNNFADTYFISATAPTGGTVTIGDLWFDTSSDTMKVYGTSGWQNAGSSVNGTSQRYTYTASGGQTTFSGVDDNGNTLAYDAGYIDCYLNCN